MKIFMDFQKRRLFATSLGLLIVSVFFTAFSFSRNQFIGADVLVNTNLSSILFASLLIGCGLLILSVILFVIALLK